MLDISVQIVLNDKSDLEIIKGILKDQDIESPIFIIEVVDRFQINYESEYQPSQIEFDLLTHFPNYEFTENLGVDQKFKLSVRSMQSPMSTDNWGRSFNSDTIESIKYFVQKVDKKNSIQIPPNPRFKVLFGETEREYTVNITPGFNNDTKEEGYLVVKTLTKETEKPDLLINQLFTDKTTAFWRGFDKLSVEIEEEFEEYKKTIKRKRKKK